LSIIDHTLKKISKNDKKKPQPVITDIEMKIIKCFKAGSLVSLGQYHEGHVVFGNDVIIQKNFWMQKAFRY
jgi:hypothetical protein